MTGQWVADGGQAVDLVGQRVSTAGHRVMDTGHAVLFAGHRVALVGQRVETFGQKVSPDGHLVGDGGHAVDCRGHRVDTAGQLVTDTRHAVDTAGQRVAWPGLAVAKATGPRLSAAVVAASREFSSKASAPRAEGHTAAIIAKTREVLTTRFTMHLTYRSVASAAPPQENYPEVAATAKHSTPTDPTTVRTGCTNGVSCSGLSSVRANPNLCRLHRESRSDKENV